MFKIANRIRFNDGAHIETYIKKEKGRENSYDVIKDSSGNRIHVRTLERSGLIIRNKEGNLLVIVDQNDRWSIPKGWKEDNETLINCAKRETREETGIVSDFNEINASSKYIIHYSNIYYIVGTPYSTSDLKNPDNSEIKTTMFVSLDTLRSNFRKLNSGLRFVCEELRM